SIAGYKKVILELGGNDPLIILEDADLELAVNLAAEGSFRNSGQRCTAAKRILVHEKIEEALVHALIDNATPYVAGDQFAPNTMVGTVIDEPAAKYLEDVVNTAIAEGADLRLGGKRRGALLEPTVLTNVSRSSQMVVEESFGPLAPIMRIKDLDDAI